MEETGLAKAHVLGLGTGLELVVPREGRSRLYDLGVPVEDREDLAPNRPLDAETEADMCAVGYPSTEDSDDE